MPWVIGGAWFDNLRGVFVRSLLSFGFCAFGALWIERGLGFGLSVCCDLLSFDFIRRACPGVGKLGGAFGALWIERGLGFGLSVCCDLLSFDFIRRACPGVGKLGGRFRCAVDWARLGFCALGLSGVGAFVFLIY